MHNLFINQSFICIFAVLMINERENRKYFLFSTLIVGICLWSFSTFNTDSLPTNLKSNNQYGQVVRVSTNQPKEFLASVNTFPFNGNIIAINNFELKQSPFNNNLSLFFDSLMNIKFKSHNQKSLDIKPEISKNLKDYILSSNKLIDYQSIS